MLELEVLRYHKLGESHRDSFHRFVFLEFGLDFMNSIYMSLFGIVVAVQSVFCLEMHQNDVFLYILKIIFEISTSK
jgi:hypothetical protein